MAEEVLVPRLNRYVPIRPTPKQAAFLLVPQREAFYGGAAGGGKSLALLAGSLQYADVAGYAALLLRRSYFELTQPNGLIDLSKQWLADTDALWRESDFTWRFRSGATLTFRHLQDARAELAFQGGEYQYIGVDEVTELDEDSYRFLFSRLRARAESTLPLRMRAASNPYGPGSEWVYQRFVVEGPSMGRTFVRAVFEDNPHLDLVSYDESLRELPPGIREQLRHGSWDVRPEGGLFKRQWFAGRFVGPERLPSDLSLCRFWDLASTEQTRGSDPDHTAGVLLGRDHDGLFYVLDVARTRTTPLNVQKLIERVSEEDRQKAFHRDWDAPAIRIEQEPGSAGKMLVDFYGRHVLQAFDFKGVVSSGSKDARAAPVSARAEAGHLLICRAPWNGAFLDELCAFPFTRHDDQVDALAGAYAELADVTGRRHVRISRAVFRDAPARAGTARRTLGQLLAASPAAHGSRYRA